MSEPETPAAGAHSLTRLDLGMLIVLAAMAIAGLLGLIAVLDAESSVGALGTGFGIAWLVLLSGGAVACGLACLARRKLEALALATLVAAGLAVDLLVLAIVLDIDSEAYAKLVGIAFVGGAFGLVVLGLALACQPRDTLSRWLFVAAVGAALLGAVLAWALILTTGTDEIAPVPVAGPTAFGLESDGLFRPLAADLVALSVLWLAALAASRVDRTAQAHA